MQDSTKIKNLERSNHYLNKVQKIAQIGFWEVNLETGENWWSDEMYQIFQVNPENGLPSVEEYLSLVHEEDRNNLINARNEAIKTGTGYILQFKILKADKINYAVNYAEVEKDLNGKSIKMFGVLQDITNRVENEHNLLEQKMRLATFNTLAAVSEMANGIVHEINNPLAIIVSNLALVVGKLAVDEKTNKNALNSLQRIEDATFRISKIIDSLKSITESNSIEENIELDLADVINGAIILCYEKIISNDVKFELKLQSGVKIKGHRASLIQVIMALLHNAHDAVINLKTKWIKLEMSQMEASSVKISITDSGHGVPQSIIHKIMNPFFSTKEVGKGMGLGLSLANKIIKDHGGVLSLDEKCPNTSFIIRLPINVNEFLMPISLPDAIDAHLKWKQRLLSYIAHPDGTLKPEEICLDNKCALGKWIYHIENKYENDLVFKELKIDHLKFHQHTAAIVHKVHQGEDLVGEVILGADSEYAQLSNKLIGLLKKIKI